MYLIIDFTIKTNNTPPFQNDKRHVKYISTYCNTQLKRLGSKYYMVLQYKIKLSILSYTKCIIHIHILQKRKDTEDGYVLWKLVGYTVPLKSIGTLRTTK